MSKANRSLKVLGEIIKRIEDDNSFVEKLEKFLADKSFSKESESRENISFDIFDEFSANGRLSLESKLNSIDENQLKLIIREHGLDSKKLAQKWKNKDRLVSLILDRVTARVEKGNVFLNFGKEE